MAVRRLLVTWALLMALTTLAGVAAGVSGDARPGALALVVLAIVVVAKCRLILARYLRLEQAPSFLAGFTAAVAVVMAIVTFVFAANLELSRGRHGAPGPSGKAGSHATATR